ncbi:MAG: hypothetical protein R3C59_25605 [Planctomycetaceae bacterium]
MYSTVPVPAHNTSVPELVRSRWARGRSNTVRVPAPQRDNNKVPARAPVRSTPARNSCDT